MTDLENAVEVLERYRKASRESSKRYRDNMGDKLKSYSFYISENEYKELKDYVDSQGLSVNGFIRSLVLEDIGWEQKK